MPSHIASPFDQKRYQVRLEWGVQGLTRLAPADVTVVVDVLRFSTLVVDAVARGERVPLRDDADEVALDAAPVAARAAEDGSVVLLGCLRNASAVAEAILAEQTRRRGRTSVSVIAVGERTGSEHDAPVRFAVEDLLGAGAVVDALGLRGIDHTSPEAAAACESFRALGAASRHLVAASGSGQLLATRDLAGDVLAATQRDAASVVPVLEAGCFRAL